MALVTLGGVSGLLTLEFAVSGMVVEGSDQLALDCWVSLMILGDTMIFFWMIMKQASFPYFPQ